MCGIAGIYLRDPDLQVDMDEITSTVLEEIEARGQHATGVVALDSEGVCEWQKASCDATTFNRYRRIIPNTARVILGHTRWATQGLPAFMENNHPIRRGPFYIIHNGHVTNDDELFQKAERHRFGDVDSEAIAAHLASLGDLSELPKVMEEIEGDAAVAAVDERDCARLMIARGRSSPLWVYAGTKVVMFASTEAAVVKAHAKHIGSISAKRLFFLKEGIALEWKGAEDYEVQEFKVKERKWVYRSSSVVWPATSWDALADDDYDSPYKWEASLDRQLAAVSDDDDEKFLGGPVEDKRDKHPDMDTIICDNCDRIAFWDEATVRWVAGEDVSFNLCVECAEEWDENMFLKDEGLWTEEDEIDDDGFSFRRVYPNETDDFDPDEIEIEDLEIIDDYAGANESIIRSLARKIVKGGSDAV